MLSTNSTSSIQKRRQTHRRQQSLEVPILATPLPAHPRRTRPVQAHRRGLSLDQSLSELQSPTGFRPLLPQDQGPTPPVRIQIENTNTGHQGQIQQHFVQETQQHSLNQPGHLAQDFRSHLHQQLNGNVTPIVAPIPTHPNQEQALQELQHHLEWYQQKFGHSPAPESQPDNLINLTQPHSDNMSANAVHPQMSQQQLVHLSRTVTPISHNHPHAQTVPNTPQTYIQTWPSPPPTDVKHARSQSFQYDVAPMPMAFDGHAVHASSSAYAQSQNSYPQDVFAVTGNEQGYASSVYSSSMVDPMSPGPNNLGGLPTLYEESTLPVSDHMHHEYLQAAAGASGDFNSPHFMVGGAMGGMSPRTAMLHNLGDEVNASIVETGVPPEQVDAYISSQHPVTRGWTCEFTDEETGKSCGKFFKRKENARSHVQNHLGDRQFCCNDCGKTFVRQHDMKRHASIHKDDRPHVCPCGSGFARHDALTRHRQRGMCKGALPGFEKAEEDKPKRGRPKKERPDMDERTTKAQKARKLDQAHEQAKAASYASSHSSGMTDSSLPMTPPDSTDYVMDADNFINLVQTPPTSPQSPQKSSCISPAALLSNAPASSIYESFTGASSPENGYDLPNDMIFGAVGAEPGVSHQDIFSDTNAFSPEYSSLPGSSPPSCGEGFEEFGPMDSVLNMGWAAEVTTVGGMGDHMDDGAAMAAMLDRWIASQ